MQIRPARRGRPPMLAAASFAKTSLAKFHAEKFVTI